MRFTAPLPQLLDAVTTAGRAATTRSAVQALSGVRIIAGDQGVELGATNVEVGLRVRLDAEVERPGQTLLSASMLRDILASLKGAATVVTLTQDQGQVTVQAALSTFNLRELRLEDFPTLPEVKDTDASIPGGVLARGVAAVSRAASGDEARPMLTAIKVTLAGGNLEMVATDAYRLVVFRAPVDHGKATITDALVPARAMETVRATLNPEEDVQLGIGTRASFRIGDTQFSSALITAGQFPDWRTFVRLDEMECVVLPAAALLGPVQRVNLMAGKDAPLRLAVREGEIEVSTRTPELGDAREAFPVPYGGPDEVLIGLNPRYLLDGLALYPEGNVKLYFTTGRAPVVIQGEEAGSPLYLQMPMNLPDAP